MPCCSAYGCSNRSDIQGIQDRTDPSQRRTYHKFPNDPARKRQWLVNVRRHDFVPTRYSRLCSDHFEEWCFDRTGSIVRLRETAVPTIFSFSSKNKNQRKRTISGGENNTGEPSCKKPAKENGKTVVKNEINSDEDNVSDEEESSTPETTRRPFTVYIKQEQSHDEETLINEELDKSYGSTNTEESNGTISDTYQENEISVPVSPERVTKSQTKNASQANIKRERDADNTVGVHPTSKGAAKDKIIYLPDNRTYFEFATPKKKVILQLKPPKSEPSQLRTLDLEELVDSLRTRQLITNEVQELLESFGELPRGLERLTAQGPRSYTEPSEAVKKFSSVLYTFAPKAFDLVGKEFSLPDKQVLQDRLKVRKYWPGFTKESLTILENKIEKTPGNRICSIMMDSVDLKKQHSYDKENDRWIGHLEFGGGQEPCDSDEIPLATEVLIFTAVGIGSHWKLPFGYFLNKGMGGEELQNLLLEAISCLQDCGLSVRAVVCEGSVSTVKMGTLLGCKIHTKLPNEMITGFPNPSNHQKKIHLIFGFQHAFTLLRHLLEDKSVLRSSIYGIIRWKFFKELLTCKGKSDQDLITSVNSEHRKFYHLQNIIRLCSPGFCFAVSHALQLAEERGIAHYAGSKATANFCADLYRAFDLLNSRSHACKEKPPLDPLFLAEQLESMSIIGQRIFDLELLSGSPVKIGGRWMSVTLLPFTLKSVGHLASELLTERAIPHLATYRLNLYHSTQILNCIEKRGGWDGTLTASQFRSGYKKLLTQCFRLLSDRESYNNDFEGEDLTVGQGLSCPLRGNAVTYEMDEDLAFRRFSAAEYDTATPVAATFVRHISQKLSCTECVSLMTSDVAAAAENNSAKVYSARFEPSSMIKEILQISEKFLDTYSLDSESFNEEHLVVYLFQKYMTYSTKLDKLDHSHIMQEPHHIIGLIKVFIRTFIRCRLNNFKERCQMRSRLLQRL